MTTLTAPPPAPAAPARRRPGRRALGTALLTAAAVVLALTPFRASGWDPTASAGPRIGSDAAPAGVGPSVVPGPVLRIADVTWSGASAWPLTAPSGTLTADGWVGRLEDEDQAGDYYLVVLATSWTHDAGLARVPAPVTVSLTSDVAAAGNLYDATGSFTSGAGCDELVAVPIGGPVGSATARACRGFGVERTGLDDTHVSWLVEQPAGLRAVDLVYFQKVPAGVRPTWTVEVTTPTGRRSNLPWLVGPMSVTSVVASLEP